MRLDHRFRKVTLVNEIEVSPGFLPGRAECSHGEHFRHDNDRASFFATIPRSGVLHSIRRSVPGDAALFARTLRSHCSHNNYHDYHDDDHDDHPYFDDDHGAHVNINVNNDDDDRSDVHYDNDQADDDR